MRKCKNCEREHQNISQQVDCEYKMTDVSLSALIGLTLKSIAGKEGDCELRFDAESGEKFLMYHRFDCCESVILEEISGDLSDLIGSPILQSEAVSSDGVPGHEGAESFTWTFYKLATLKGHVTLRWYGESNGYYSEEVEFKRRS